MSPAHTAGAAGSVLIGVLALQGDVREHARVLTALGARVRQVRAPADLDGIEGLVIPGGESSVMDRLARLLGLAPAVQERIRGGLPVYGTCAGMIMLADRIANPITGQGSLGGLDLTVLRNAFGSQVDSFETDLSVPAVSADPVHTVFIRAPAVVQAGPDVQVLAAVPASGLDPRAQQQCRDHHRQEHDGGAAGVGAEAPAGSPEGEVPVAVRQGSLLATSFHPEVTGDWSFHRHFLEMVESWIDSHRPALHHES